MGLFDVMPMNRNRPKTHRQFLALVWLCGLFSSSPVFASSDLEIALDLFSLFTPSSDSNAEPTQETSQLIVRIGLDRLWIVGADQEQVYDFDEKRLYTVDRGEGSYTQTSLFADVGFRDYELQNRKFLSGVLESAGVEENPMSLVLSEHELSVSDRSPNDEIERRENAGNVIFRSDGKELMVVSGSRVKVPSEYQKPFIRFIRYQYGGHPSIVGELTTASGIPERITVASYNSGAMTYELHLRSVKEVDSQRFSLDGLAKNTNVGEKLQKLELQLGPSPIKAREASAERVLKNARKATSAGNYAEGMLQYLEYSLITGDQNLPWSESERTSLLASEDVKEILAAIDNPGSQEEAESAINSLVALRATYKDVEHVLKIFEANIRAAAGDQKLARELMIEALNKNPYVAGAWKDLGGFYFQSYETQEAWFCWDAARRISPNHPLLDQVYDFEYQLESTRPGFF